MQFSLVLWQGSYITFHGRLSSFQSIAFNRSRVIPLKKNKSSFQSRAIGIVTLLIDLACSSTSDLCYFHNLQWIFTGLQVSLFGVLVVWDISQGKYCMEEDQTACMVWRIWEMLYRGRLRHSLEEEIRCDLWARRWYVYQVLVTYLF